MTKCIKWSSHGLEHIVICRMRQLIQNAKFKYVEKYLEKNKDATTLC